MATSPSVTEAACATSPMLHRLEQSRSVIESRFLQAGEVLALAVDGIGQLIGSLDRLAGTLDPQTVAATTAELNGSAETLLGMPERHAGRRERIRKLHRMSGDLRAQIEEMRRDLAYLRVFAINIKVTSAGIANAGEDFALFAQEISDRIEAGRVELERFASEVLALHDQLAAALDEEQVMAGHCARLIPAVPDGLRAGAQDMAAHHEKVSRVAADVSELARQIQRKVGSALAALQVGDSTRQRIEHVQTGLKRLETEPLAPAVKAQVESFVRRLLSAQLSATAADFHRDSAQIHRSMADLASDANEILRLRDLALGRSASGDGFLERMTAHLGQALELVTRMEAADAAAGHTGRSAAGAASALNTRIEALQSIKTDVQQMALNTTLKCARIGDPGKPLAVIAIELRAHAGYLETSAHASLATVGALAGDATLLAQEEAGVDAGAALTEATGRLRRANETVDADLAELARQGEAVVRALGDAAVQLDFHGEIGTALDAAAAALAEPAGEPPSELGAAAEPLAAILQDIFKTYTMAQEREVHTALAAGLELAAPAVPAAPARSNELEDVLF